MDIRYSTLKIKHSVLTSGNDLPAMEKNINVQNKVKAELTEDDEIFLGFGFRDNAYPYTNQSDYEEMVEDEVKTVVLENEWLIATFLPEYGGRLWSLWDKENETNLLYTNDVIQMRNLAIRNAWFSGGVEWNLSSVGHSAFTCASLYVAEVDDGDKKVLRMYGYERLRGVCYQMEFWLEGKELLCRMRIDNKNNEMIPMYWWSNIAVPEYPGGRVVAPATEAYANTADSGVYKTQFPMIGGKDLSFYNYIPFAVDYFFDIPSDQCKFEANLDSNGVGLLHYSTNRLQGRKLFCWGHNQGAGTWQKFLTESAGDYIEIQAGLGKTQYECIPMPPNTAWEWIESYSRLDLAEEEVMGDYDRAVAAVNMEVEKRFEASDLELLLRATKERAKSEGEPIMPGSGYGALELIGNGERMSSHLSFEIEKDLSDWQNLLEKGVFKTEVSPFVPKSYMHSGIYWERLLKALEDKETYRAYALYHLGVMSYDREAYELAYDYLAESLKEENNAYTLFAMSYVCQKLKDESAYRYATQGIRMMPNHYSYVEKMMKLLLDGQRYEDILKLEDTLDPDRSRDRLKMYFAFAYANMGRKSEAKSLLSGGLVINDVREGEIAISDLWMLLHGDEPVPERYDYRLS